MFGNLDGILGLIKNGGMNIESIFNMVTKSNPKFGAECLAKAREFANKRGGDDSPEFEKYAREWYKRDGVDLSSIGQ